MNIKEENIVFLTITFWVNTCAMGKHYYGRLRSFNGKWFDVVYKLSKEDAKDMNKGWLSKDTKDYIGYNEGEESERFISKERLIAEARKQFKKYFPKAKVLVLGDRAVIEPQEILVGPREFKIKINRLVRRAKELKYWDNEKEMDKLCKKWEKMWPRKYI